MGLDELRINKTIFMPLEIQKGTIYWVQMSLIATMNENESTREEWETAR